MHHSHPVGFQGTRCRDLSLGDSSGVAPGVRGSGVVGVTGVGGWEDGAGGEALGDFPADIAVEIREMRDSVVATWVAFGW